MMANTMYQFQFDIIWLPAVSGTGIGFAVNGPTIGTGFVLVRTEIPTSSTAVTHGMQRVYDTGTNTTTIDSAANCYAKCYGFVSNGSTAGNLVLRFKSENTNQVSILVGTIGKMWRISPSN